MHMDRETWYNERHRRGGATSPPAFSAATVKKSRPSSPGVGVGSSAADLDEYGASDEDPAPLAPSEELKRMTVTSLDRFHGKSSGLVLVQTAIDMKREYTGGEFTAPEHLPGRREFYPEVCGPARRAYFILFYSIMRRAVGGQTCPRVGRQRHVRVPPARSDGVPRVHILLPQ